MPPSWSPPNCQDVRQVRDEGETTPGGEWTATQKDSDGGTKLIIAAALHKPHIRELCCRHQRTQCEYMG
ncbi:hypothetical protein J6590_031304 [Homalodisca vitripennis]|nr:hypothetical protein J6590_031304 [Homalodisca vitripennis]